jgi:hypothetical protein
MSIIGLRFRSMAARIKVLNLNHPDLEVEKVQLVIELSRLTGIVEKARSRGVDLDDPYEVWELLGIDAVISLEDIQGQHHRVAISIVEREDRAYRLMKQRQTYSWKDVRVALGMHCHWVLCVNGKHLPDDGEWIDILYHQIDIPRGWSDCRLINL